MKTTQSHGHSRDRCAHTSLGVAVIATLAGAAPALAGDFNGDGFEDIVIGAPSEDIGTSTNAGAVTVMYGSAAGLHAKTTAGAPIAAQLWHQNKPGVPGICKKDDRFGESSAAGDFNLDGFDDLIIGIPGKKLAGMSAAGQILILWGGPGGLTSVGAMTMDQTFFGDPIEAGDEFGFAVATGDLNGDAFDDIVIGAPYEDMAFVDQGSVHVMYSLGTGIWVPFSPPTMDQSMLGDPPFPGDYFGWSLAIGDWNLDGFEDLAIGAPGDDVGGAIVDAGMVNVAHGSPGGLFGGPIYPVFQDSLPAGDPSEPGDNFGYSLAAGQMAFGPEIDLAIGIPGEDMIKTDCGAVCVVGGTFGIGLDPSLATFIIQETFGTGASSKGDQMGLALAAGDVDGDSFDDLAIGIPGERSTGINKSGRVLVLAGSPPGVGFGFATSAWHQNSPGIAGSCEIKDRFGHAVALQDFNGDGLADLASGVPYEDAGAMPDDVDAGYVNVIYGSPVGITSTGDQALHQNRPGMPNKNDAGDNFGFALGQ